MMISTLPGCLIFLVFTAACVVQDLRSLRIDLHIFLAMAGAELLWYPTAYLSGSSPDLRSLFAAAGAGVLLLLLVLTGVRGQSAGKRRFPFLPFAAIPVFCFLLAPYF